LAGQTATFTKFQIGGFTIGAPELIDDEFDGPRSFEASEIRLRDLTFPYDTDPTLSIVYEYDFGDCWRHHMNLRRLPREAGVSYPRCVAGERSGPPEDVGGYSGYLDFLEVDPAHEKHKDMRRWVRRKFDPEHFDLDATNKAIARAVRASRGDYRFRRVHPK